MWHKRREFKVLDLSPYFNNDGISWDTDRSDGDFGYEHGMTFPAEELPESNSIVTLCGVDFLFPDKSDGAKNNMVLEGQTVPVPVGRYSEVYILGASDWGSFEEKVVLLYSDGGREEVTLGLTECFAHGRLRFGEKEAIVCTGYHFPDADVHSPRGNTSCGIWLQTLKVDPERELEAIQFGDNPSMHIFAITLRSAVCER